MIGHLDEFISEFRSVDRKAIVALIYSAVGLACIYYLQEPAVLYWIADLFGAHSSYLRFGRNDNLVPLLWWASIAVAFYFVLPALIVKGSFKRNLSEFGLATKAERDLVPILFGAIGLMLPIVCLMSLTEGFAAKYPFLQFYGEHYSIGWTLLVWEIVYFAQFFGLEFFFRGFLIQSLKPAIGILSIPVMVVPYTMIHFGKPMPETFAAVIAGFFLGWLSYRSGSIWLGVILHCSVALAMDVFSLYAKGIISV